MLISFIATVTNDTMVTSDHTQLVRIAENTTWSFWQDGICFIAIISLILSCATLYTLYREFRNDRLDAECQRRLFHDIVRHLYRNKLCTMAMRVKYEACMAANKNFKGYPSEEHYKKMQLLPDDIHLERYNRNAQMHQKMHELELLLRNYNTEIEVAERHIVNAQIGNETIKRDFDTLDFKTGYLTKRIYEVMQAIYHKENVKEQIQNLIYDSHSQNLKHNSDESYWGKAYEEEAELLLKVNDKGDWYFKIFDDYLSADRLRKQLRIDLIIECGLNSKQEEKVHIIKL